ncbi:(2Fe-2S)-binding protein [Wenzhouxiangella marina]|uniref:(2Fe-2S)-binding protein n=1 Tax=Wenzhouxiangella marina TaxID=1579979 RepID=A0A0K0XV40_9GAMM|nr:(2Fe-2S)-binding protein [Wenzhouxiangella marina]AKS41486.1 (2Fe-2S)-binding protein [Wenzhouxiangella marina]MBB6086756.1 bacterioferritin-associated ferredoxin [Wenzhouxiangella marina]
MYVCVCNAIKVDTLSTLASEGLSFEEIRALTNCSNCCGSCEEFAQSVVERAHQQAGSSPRLPVHVLR